MFGHKFSFILGRFREMEFLCCVVRLCFTFKEMDTLFAKWLHNFTFPQALYEGPNFCMSSPTLAICCLFDDGHPDGGEVLSHCDSDLHFPLVISDMKRLLMCLLAICMCSPEKCLLMNFAFFFFFFFGCTKSTGARDQICTTRAT